MNNSLNIQYLILPILFAGNVLLAQDFPSSSKDNSTDSFDFALQGIPPAKWKFSKERVNGNEFVAIDTDPGNGGDVVLIKTKTPPSLPVEDKPIPENQYERLGMFTGYIALGIHRFSPNNFYYSSNGKTGPAGKVLANGETFYRNMRSLTMEFGGAVRGPTKALKHLNTGVGFSIYPDQCAKVYEDQGGYKYPTSGQVLSEPCHEGNPLSYMHVFSEYDVLVLRNRQNRGKSTVVSLGGFYSPNQPHGHWQGGSDPLPTFVPGQRVPDWGPTVSLRSIEGRDKVTGFDWYISARVGRGFSYQITIGTALSIGRRRVAPPERVEK